MIKLLLKAIEFLAGLNILILVPWAVEDSIQLWSIDFNILCAIGSERNKEPWDDNGVKNHISALRFNNLGWIIDNDLVRVETIISAAAAPTNVTNKGDSFNK